MTRRIRELVLWAGAALGLLAVACGLAVALGGISFLVFRSGSMEPTISTGGLAISRTVTADEIEPGDVVSVLTSGGERVSHRVVSSTVQGEHASLVLQGDANRTPDQEVYVVSEAERVIASVPYGGYVLAHALTPPGLVALACLSGMLLVLSSGDPERPSTPRQPPTKRPARRPRRGAWRRAGRAQAAMSVVALVTVAGLLSTSGVRGTWATFTDPATMASGTFAARILDLPTGVNCSTVGGAYIRWTAPAGPVPTGYRLTFLRDGVPGTADVAAGVLQWRPPGPGLFATDTYTDVRVSSLLGAVWTSLPSTTSDTILVQNFIFNTWSCP